MQMYQLSHQSSDTKHTPSLHRSPKSIHPTPLDAPCKVDLTGAGTSKRPPPDRTLRSFPCERLALDYFSSPRDCVDSFLAGKNYTAYLCLVNFSTLRRFENMLE